MATASGVPEDKPLVGALRPFPFDGPSLQVGDEILAINGAATPDFAAYGAVADAIAAAPAVTYHIRREGATYNGSVPVACRFLHENKYSKHFPHAMQQLYSCYSYLLSCEQQQQQRRILVVHSMKVTIIPHYNVPTVEMTSQK